MRLAIAPLVAFVLLCTGCTDGGTATTTVTETQTATVTTTLIDTPAVKAKCAGNPASPIAPVLDAFRNATLLMSRIAAAYGDTPGALEQGAYGWWNLTTDHGRITAVMRDGVVVYVWYARSPVDTEAPEDRLRQVLRDVGDDGYFVGPVGNNGAEAFQRLAGHDLSAGTVSRWNESGVVHEQLYLPTLHAMPTAETVLPEDLAMREAARAAECQLRAQNRGDLVPSSGFMAAPESGTSAYLAAQGDALVYVVSMNTAIVKCKPDWTATGSIVVRVDAATARAIDVHVTQPTCPT